MEGTVGEKRMVRKVEGDGGGRECEYMYMLRPVLLVCAIHMCYVCIHIVMYGNRGGMNNQSL